MAYNPSDYSCNNCSDGRCNQQDAYHTLEEDEEEKRKKGYDIN